MSKLAPFSSPAQWAFLQEGLTPISLAELPEFWRMTVLTVLCRPPRGFQFGPWVPGFLRGAWGHQLLKLAQGGGFTPLGIPARDIFFTTPLTGPGGHELPPPYAIAVDRAGPDIQVSLTLFGRAEAWRQDAFDGMISGLERGISLSERGGEPEVSFEVVEAIWKRTERTEVLRYKDLLNLDFVTPVQFSSVEALLVSTAERVSGLAAWQGFALALPEPTDMAGFVTETDLFTDGWTRRSGAQKGRHIPVSGRIGRVTIHAPSRRIQLLLALGATCFIGQNASLGMGRFNLN